MRFRENPRRELPRMLAAGVYLGFFRHLPWSPRPGGKAARRLRAMTARWMLDHCGERVNVEHGAWFGSGRGIRVGDRSDIGMDALVIGPLTVGNDVMMGPRCTLIASSHCVSSTVVPMNQQGFVPDRPIVIEDDVWVGAGSTLLPGVTVGRGSIVGAGSVVVKNVPPGSVVAGNPAQVIRRREDLAASLPTDYRDRSRGDDEEPRVVHEIPAPEATRLQQ